MENFFRSIPAAASSPYALVAYAIAALLFLFAGAKLRMAKLLLAQITSIPPEERRRALEIATGTVLPNHISAEQWIRHSRSRWTFLLLVALLIVILVIATIAIVNPTTGALTDIKSKIERAEYASLRGSYPLEPLELSFVIEYPMDQPRLTEYTERLRRDIVSYLREQRAGRKPTSENLADEDVLFVVTNMELWKPTTIAAERTALPLLGDDTRFHYRDGHAQEKDLQLLSTSKDIADAIITMRRHGDISQRIELSADFDRRLFVKSVLCRNPVRTGSDVTSVSSLDLIGRQLSWEPDGGGDLSSALVSFDMRFSYDKGFGQLGARLPAGRSIDTGTGQPVIITAEHVGLSDVLK